VCCESWLTPFPQTQLQNDTSAVYEANQQYDKPYVTVQDEYAGKCIQKLKNFPLFELMHGLSQKHTYQVLCLNITKKQYSAQRK
jgi:hypothetical protein